MHAYIDLFPMYNLENSWQMTYIWFTVGYAECFGST